MSEADLLQPGNIVRDRWKVVSAKKKKKIIFFDLQKFIFQNFLD
jgi:hypothetical protein